MFPQVILRYECTTDCCFESDKRYLSAYLGFVIVYYILHDSIVHYYNIVMSLYLLIFSKLYRLCKRKYKTAQFKLFYHSYISRSYLIKNKLITFLHKVFIWNTLYVISFLIIMYLVPTAYTLWFLKFMTVIQCTGLLYNT